MTIHPNGTGDYVSRWIELKEETIVSTGYRGRGKQPLSLTLPVGTPVHYRKSVNWTDGLNVWVHEVTYHKDGVRYSAFKRTSRKGE